MMTTLRLMCNVAGDIDGATGLIQRCLEVDQTSSDAHILMAQVDTHHLIAKLTPVSADLLVYLLCLFIPLFLHYLLLAKCERLCICLPT